MGFKGLNDAHKRRALSWFLRAADHIHGFCCVIAIDKRVGNMFTREGMAAEMVARGLLQCEWTAKSVERMLRIVNFLSIFMAILTNPMQNVYWISDEDELFANPNRALDTKRMLERFTSAYISHPLGEVGLGTTRIDEKTASTKTAQPFPILLPVQRRNCLPA